MGDKGQNWLLDMPVRAPSSPFESIVVQSPPVFRPSCYPYHLFFPGLLLDNDWKHITKCTSIFSLHLVLGVSSAMRRDPSARNASAAAIIAEVTSSHHLPPTSSRRQPQRRGSVGLHPACTARTTSCASTRRQNHPTGRICNPSSIVRTALPRRFSNLRISQGYGLFLILFSIARDRL